MIFRSVGFPILGIAVCAGTAHLLMLMATGCQTGPHFKNPPRTITDMKVGEVACTIFISGTVEHHVWLDPWGEIETCHYLSRAKVERLGDKTWKVTVNRPLDADLSDDRYQRINYIKADEVAWAW